MLTALVGNLAVAAVKFAAFLFTRSTAMLTEAIHSLVDTGNEVLLLIGSRQGARAPDDSHPFGYGMETYFWSFVVALMVFTVGGVASLHQGIEKLIHPAPIERPWISFVVLGASAVFEGVSFRAGYRQYRRFVRRHGLSGETPLDLLTFLKRSKDPNLFSTLIEDGAALIGLALAAIGTAFAVLLHATWADGAASTAIGLLLICIAVFMANETRSLIAGEAAAPNAVKAITGVVKQAPHVREIKRIATLQLGPDNILAELTLVFDPHLSARELGRAAADIRRRVREAEPRATRILVRSSGWEDVTADAERPAEEDVEGG